MEKYIRVWEGRFEVDDEGDIRIDDEKINVMIFHGEKVRLTIETRDKKEGI